MSLNSRARDLTKSFKAIQGIIDVFFILQKSEKRIIIKMTIGKLGKKILVNKCHESNLKTWSGLASSQTL